MVSDASTAPAPVRWGILATGKIAGSFARDLALLPDHEVVAAGSRTRASAEAFVAEHGTDGARAYGSYEDLAADPDVDVVYVASPHGRHAEDVTLCLDAGKAVLCEKALTLDAASGRDLVRLARERGLFLAEAMWMRTNPVIREVERLVSMGALGEVTELHAELGFDARPDVARLWEPELGASALLDIGIYPLTLAHLLLGHPTRVEGTATMHERGFDVDGTATLEHPGGAVSRIAWSQVEQPSDTATIVGTQGRVEIAARFHHPTSFRVVRGDDVDEVTLDVIGRGYAHEAIEVAECLRAGRTESALLPLDDTVAIQEVMDDLLARFRG